MFNCAFRVFSVRVLWALNEFDWTSGPDFHSALATPSKMDIHHNFLGICLNKAGCPL